jgi:hypothetical protein
MGQPKRWLQAGQRSNDSDSAINADRWARHCIYLARPLRLGLRSDG